MEPEPDDPSVTALVIATVTGTNAIRVSAGTASGTVAVTDNGVSLGQFAVAGSIYVYTPAGQSNVNTTLTLDYSKGYFGVPDGVTFAGSGNDKLNVSGGNFAAISDNTITTGAGDILLQPATGSSTKINYEGVVSVTVTSGSSDVSIGVPIGSQDVALKDSGTSGMETLSSSSAQANFTFADPTDTLRVDGNSSSGTEKLSVQPLNPSFDANLAIALVGGDDEVDFASSKALYQGKNVGATAGSIDIQGSPLATSQGGNIAVESITINEAAKGPSGATGSINVFTDGGTAQVAVSPLISVPVNLDGKPVGSPSITSQPAAQTVIPGVQATFSAAAAGDPPATVQWWVSSDQGQTYVPIPGATSSSLVFIAQASDSGKLYRAVFANTKGSAETNAVALTVDVPPTVVTEPTAQTVIAGDEVTFTAGGAGNPPATVQWLVSTDQGRTYAPIPGATSSSLTFVARASDSGKLYRAVFTNAGGTAETNAVDLTVNVPPSPPVIIGEQAIFRRKTNKKGKPVGKAVLQGFTLEFSRPMGSGAGDAADYSLGMVVSKARKKKPARMSPVGITVAYTPSSDAVTVNIAGNQTFANGGLLVVSDAVSSSDGAPLSGSKSFSIGKGGKTIGPE